MASSSKRNLKPIETSYKGYRFRSRKEARYAVFFDALGIEWEYEPEGFDLGDGDYYLPDFLLSGALDLSTWVEVKGKHPTEDEIRKATKLQQQSRIPVVIAWDTLEPRDLVEMTRTFKGLTLLNDDESGVFYAKDIGFGEIFRFAHKLTVQQACEKARSARFEKKKRKRRKKR